MPECQKPWLYSLMYISKQSSKMLQVWEPLYVFLKGCSHGACTTSAHFIIAQRLCVWLVYVKQSCWTDLFSYLEASLDWIPEQPLLYLRDPYHWGLMGSWHPESTTRKNPNFVVNTALTLDWWLTKYALVFKGSMLCQQTGAKDV